MLAKSAIHKVTYNFQSGFYTRIFLAPKKNGKWRPVINLKPLNQYLKKQHFKMSTPADVIQEVEEDDWLISVDLKDAYFHVPVHPSQWKFLRFCVGNDMYEFKVLPFGITTAPRVFTKMLAPVAEHIRREIGLYTSPYLDDFLAKDKERSFLAYKSREMVQFMLDVGLRINWEKSDLTPSQDTVHIGLRLMTKVGMVSVPEDRIEAIIQIVMMVQRRMEVSAGLFLRLLGCLNSVIFQVEWGRLFLRPIQLYLQSFWRPSSGTLDDSIPVLNSLRRHLDWWRNRKNLERGLPLSPSAPNRELVTDASLEGWGAYLLKGGETRGSWSLQEKSRHINYLEMLAVFNALRYFRGMWNAGDIIQVKSDNMTVVTYVNKQGGTKSSTLCFLTWDLLNWCRDRNLKLMAVYVQGEKNVLADLYSRKGLPHEWSLCPAVVEDLFQLWGRPQVDLFASRYNNKLPLYCSLERDPNAVAHDALMMSWDGMEVYAPVGVSPRSAAFKFSCLEDRRRRLREKGFREETAELATGDIRKSTEFCYNARVKVFVNWCHKNGVKDPISSPLAFVCNFLQEIFREGKASKTVGGYIAALSKWHRRIHGRKLCNIEEVAIIRKATVIARPPRKINFQSWSLPLVLDSLFQEPYEPMEGAQLKFLAHKTVFLVAVSTARRSSELGALSVGKSRFFVKPQGIEVGYVPGFIPKNARMNYAGKTIVIPKFEDMASCEEERLLCPVRAVKCYKRRMDLLRKGGEKRLFITYGNGEKQGCGASKKTIARWITDTIKFAYSNASEDTQRLMKIKAHSVRAAATTYAVLKGVEVRHILEADWATPTTFIDYYFRPGTGPGQEFATSVLKSASR